MAKQITQLPVAASVAASDVFPLDQSGTTKQATLTAIAAGLPANGTGGLVRQLSPTFGEIRVSNINGVSDAGAYSIVAGVGLSATGGGFMQFWGGSYPYGNAGKLFFGSGTSTHSAFDSAGNLGIGTLAPAAKLHVGSGSIRLDNNQSIQFTDTFGSTPAFSQQSDNNFVFYGTNSTGGQRAIFTSIMRSDTEPLQVAVPLRIGVGGSSISAAYTAVVTHTPATIAANGGVQFLDVTVTGLTGACNLFVNSFYLSNTSILVRAEFQANDVARVFWVNPTASPVTLSAATYRVSGIVFA